MEYDSNMEDGGLGRFFKPENDNGSSTISEDKKVGAEPVAETNSKKTR